MIRYLRLFVALCVLSASDACKYQREEVIECVIQSLSQYDQDGDGQISKPELEQMLRHSLGWFERKMAVAMGAVENTFRLCDINRNGFIDMNEFHSAPECMRSCWILEKFGNQIC